ncbi:hypothetical protein HDV02_002436, partial [Globomyces sp. JEL0801]
MSSQKLWVAYETPAKTFIDKVSIDGCEDITDLLNKLYERPLLGIPKDSPITLYQPGGEVEILPTATMQSLQDFGKDGNAPLIVKRAVFNGIDNYIDLHNTEGVVDLMVVKGTFRETTNDSLRKYRNYAETLKNDSCVDEVCKALISITSEDFPDSGFSDSPF